MSAGDNRLAVPRLRIHDDVAEQTYVVNLEDWVRAVDDPNEPGKHFSTIIELLNDEILERQPHVMEAGIEELAVNIEEFSDLKIQVLQKLVLRVGPATGPMM